MEADVERLNDIRKQLNEHISQHSNLIARKNILLDTLKSYKEQLYDEDIETLKEIYKQADYLNEQLAKTFEQLTTYHNSMMHQRKKFIEPSLKEVEESIKIEQQTITQLHEKEISLSKKISSSDTFEDMFNIMEQIKNKQETLNSYKASLRHFDANVDEGIELREDLRKKRESQYNYAYVNNVKKQLRELNNLHKTIFEQFKGQSNNKINYTYNEIQLNSDADIDKEKQYKFTVLGGVHGDAYKLSDMLCFDVAYAKYAEQKGLDCLNFLLYDQFEKLDKTLMSNTLKILTDSNQQCIMAILKQNIPDNLCTPKTSYSNYRKTTP